MEISCRTCAHRASDRCKASGYFCEVQRRYPDKRCDISFSGWVQRQGILTRIKQWFVGYN